MTNSTDKTQGTEREPSGEGSDGTLLSAGAAVVRNPLSVIAMFVLLVETIATVTLIQLEDNSPIAIPLVWFVVLFPTLIALLFFGTIWGKHAGLYSPMEYRSDDSFLVAMGRIDRMEEELEVNRAASRLALAEARKEGSSQDLDKASTVVLKTFAEVPKVPASIEDLAKLAKLDGNEVAKALEDLKQRGFVTGDSETNLWSLRDWGKIRMRKEVGLSQEDTRVLGGIRDAPERRPSVEALADRLDLTQADTVNALKRAERLGLVAPSGTIPGGWRLRSWGKIALDEARND